MRKNRQGMLGVCGAFVVLVGIQALATNSQEAALAAPTKNTKTAAKHTVYVCSIHPAVVALKPGKCPKCKMTLTKKSVQTVYTCSMHPAVLSLKPGKCPKCKMALTKRKF
jgi:hypothetical protein